jgi:hypothetical protein
MIVPNNKKRHSTLINRAVVTEIAGWGGGIFIGWITACEPPAWQHVIKNLLPKY